MEKKRSELIKRLTELIREPGRFPDGKLPAERELAQTMGVSRNLLREGIITMEALGFLDIRDRQGTFIVEPYSGEFAASLKFLSLWPDDILANLMEMRLTIEVPAAGLAAKRRTGEELERMKNCVAHLEGVQNDPDRGLSSGAVWDSTLHSLIVNAAHNPVLSRMYEGLSATMERYIALSRMKLLALDAWPGTILEEHRTIVAAITAGDPEASSEAVRRHLQAALTQLERLKDRGA